MVLKASTEPLPELAEFLKPFNPLPRLGYASMNHKIKEYWEQRAEEFQRSPAATTDDVCLRELEISTITQIFHQLDIPNSGSALDIGCGDGYSTLKIAQAMPSLNLLGIDYSEGMVKVARERLESQSELKRQVSFSVGDILQLEQVCGDSVYDIVLTDRCLINLDSHDRQSQAIAQIAEHTRPGGFYVAIENFIEGHKNMNEARRAVDLPEIPIRWHNLYFEESEFLRSAKPFFGEIVFRDFSSSYYLATRVIYSAMCQMRGETLQYRHEIHQLAVKLPWIGQFSPIRLAILHRKSS